MRTERLNNEAIDLGINVPPESYVEAICEHHPDAVGMSALLSTTMPMFKTNIEHITKTGLRDAVLIYVSGAPVTPEYCRKVGADGYAPNASA